MINTALSCLTVLAMASLPAMVVVDEKAIEKIEANPHGKIGESTSYRISDQAPQRNMEFRKRIIHKDGAIGLHVIDHDEVYYVLSGTGEVSSDGQTQILTEGMAAYLYTGANVGIKQVGDEPLTLIISYPLAERKP
ncbi:MAG: cupin domain-containing protein [Asticcacaulis sp.]